MRKQLLALGGKLAVFELWTHGPFMSMIQVLGVKGANVIAKCLSLCVGKNYPLIIKMVE